MLEGCSVFDTAVAVPPVAMCQFAVQGVIGETDSSLTISG